MRRFSLTSLLVVLVLGMLPTVSFAAPRPPTPQVAPGSELPHPTLDTLLAPGGTLDIPDGFAGAVDTTGWRMEITPDGRPRFERENPQIQAALGGDENWDSRFWNNGTSGAVHALAVLDGDLYAGGSFASAGPIQANNLARYSTTTNTWHPVGFGVNGTVSALAVSGSTLYLGGSFNRLCADAGCTTVLAANGVNNLASWNGTSFSALGNGVDNIVHALAANGSTLYIGGEFQLLCANASCTGVPVSNGMNYITSWNGTTYTSLGNGVNGQVNALAMNGATLHIGGTFTLLCADASCSTMQAANGVNRLAAWNGSTYSALGNGVNERVLALAVSGPTTYFGGAFTLLCSNADCSTTSGANGINRIGSWNGSNFGALGNGLPSLVTALAVNGGTVYIGGQFSLLCNNPDCSATQPANGVNRLAAWNTVSYSVLGQGVDGSVSSLAVLSNTIYLGGLFTRPCDNADCSVTRPTQGSNFIAGFDGFGFTQLPPVASNGVSRQVNALAVLQGSIYVAGDFRTAGQIAANRIARYTPATNSWSALGFGVNNQVLALAVQDSTLYLGGSFTRLCANADCTSTISPNGVNRIASWNGTVLAPLSSGVNGAVRALAANGSTLYIGGDFTRLCNDVACGADQPANGVNRMASWNGSSFSALAQGVNSGVSTIAIQGSTVYLGGIFTLLCSAADCSTTHPAGGTNRIASWNGTSFSALANGLNGSVSAFTVQNGSLFLGGSFTQLCSTADCLTLQAPNGINRVASWNGTTFGALGNGVNGAVFALSASPTTLYLGGSFTQTCATPDCTTTGSQVRGIASWNGSTYGALGAGVNVFVFALLTTGGDTYVGGSMTTAGTTATGFIGRWGEFVDLRVGVTPSTSGALSGTVVTYTVVLTNTGPATALSTTLTLDLPPTATFDTITTSKGTCSSQTTCTADALAPGQTITVTVGMTLTTGPAATLVATATSNQVDQTPADNTGQATIVVLVPLVLPVATIQREI